MSPIVVLSLGIGLCIIWISHLIARRLTRFYSRRTGSFTFLFVAVVGLYYLLRTPHILNFYFCFWLAIIAYELAAFFYIYFNQ